MNEMEWSKPHYGVQHLGYCANGYWATVQDYESFAELLKWFPGCGFRPLEEMYCTVEQARAAGERWVKTQLANAEWRGEDMS